MTDQPSQRAMKAAQILANDSRKDAKEAGALLVGEHAPEYIVQLFASVIDQEFPAYLETREALERIKVELDFDHEEMTHAEKKIWGHAEAALAKARKVGAQP